MSTSSNYFSILRGDLKNSTNKVLLFKANKLVSELKHCLKITFPGSSAQDGGIGGYASPLCTTKRRKQPI